jgi:hypothetical protein
VVVPLNAGIVACEAISIAKRAVAMRDFVKNIMEKLACKVDEERKHPSQTRDGRPRLQVEGMNGQMNERVYHYLHPRPSDYLKR